MFKSGLTNLSQSHLNLLSICPPKFQQVYLDCLGSIPDPLQQENMEWGNRFHLVMQQRELKLPIEPLLASDVELDAAVKESIQTVPELIEPQQAVWREAEHCRTLGYGNFMLTVIYDLLVAQKDQGIILDWKTYRKPQKRSKLANNWQTRLYLYVLTETSEYTPEQIQMTYWFVKSGKPKNVAFNYSEALHRQTEQDLSTLLVELETWLQNYQQANIDFPHRPHCEQKCPYFKSLAKETSGSKDPQELLDAIAEIEEISI
ncbi:PD-(D/E)XK nuclease family protein [Waterburya agarophytonicola K14]|uniref:PD-(D/E)XK nuclease family protein n=1 Tax=Waterburya agarophytonicola KI4 TaxID=2874699 RepID=A0A964BPB5_9CYAN|nr:PD-(D/E)XK nuclease family protein [Waterburya agarophytonicola]MCC0176377.1 PD-(D/E)XK nuclease family protein [Waterburya agarophytonicola KI4]